jgi:hypothetical protein
MPDAHPQREVCARHGEIGPCTHLVGVTTPHQPDSMRIFQKLAFRQQHQIITWPAFAVLGKYEQHIGFPAADYGSDATPHMLDWLPGGCWGRRRCAPAPRAEAGHQPPEGAAGPAGRWLGLEARWRSCAWQQPIDDAWPEARHAPRAAGVRQHLEQDQHAQHLLPQWQRCASLEELRRAVAYIRRHQQQLQQPHQGVSSRAATAAPRRCCPAPRCPAQARA